MVHPADSYSPTRKLKKIRQKVVAIRKRATTFGEELVLNHIIYSIDEAVKAYASSS